MNEELLPTPLIEVKNLRKWYRLRKKQIEAVAGVSLSIQKGKVLGLVGESGSGKSTLGRLILNLEIPNEGEVFFDNVSIYDLNKILLKKLRSKMQMIFQDPYASLNPRMKIGEIIQEGLIIHKLGTRSEQREVVIHNLRAVGLDEAALMRYPHEFSGGQRQRIGIARALAVNPEFVVCDEPTSSLDTQTKWQILNLLSTLKRERKLTYLIISHDLEIVREIADEVAVMYAGVIVEQAPTDQLFTNGKHPYTQKLLSLYPNTNRNKYKLH